MTTTLADIFAEEDAAASAAFRATQTPGTPEYLREQARLAADRARRDAEPVAEIPDPDEDDEDDEDESEEGDDEENDEGEDA
jgi:hypothetical protein